MVKPTRAGLHTNLVITTSRRTICSNTLTHMVRHFRSGPSTIRVGIDRYATRCANLCLAADHQLSPGYCALTFTLMPVGSTSVVPCKYRALTFPAVSPQRLALSASCSSGQRFARSFLPTPPHGDAVAALLTFPRAGYVKDFHLLVSAPCRAHRDYSALRASPLRGRPCGC
jgi:hypothetical protein